MLTVQCGEVVYSIWDTTGIPDSQLVEGMRFSQTDMFIVFEGGQGKSTDEWIETVLTYSPNASIHIVNNPNTMTVSTILTDGE